MSSTKDLKKIAQDKYAGIALQSNKFGCGCGCSKETDYSAFNLNYAKVDGYVVEADLNLGCGIPTEFAGIKKGDTVIDLGAGAGNDVFVARRLTGETGHVIGIDMTPEMIDRANINKDKLGFKNVEFKLGDIENLPLADNTADVVVSNCVLNLVPDKQAAFNEVYRVLKPAARFCISDIVLQGEIPVGLKQSAEMYAGCVSGALQRDDYLKTIKNSGFVNIEIKNSRGIILPDDVLDSYLDRKEKDQYRHNNTGIYSITVVGQKPL